MSRELPKYRRISDQIISSIRKGELLPGMKTPSETRIIEDFGVSNTTARKALQYLEMSGWAKRVKGKGTFVQKRQVLRRVDKILSFTKNMHEAGYIPSTRLLTAEEVPEGYASMIGGRRYSMAGPVYRILRLRFADDNPVLLEERYISKQLCPEIPDQFLEGSLYDLYENGYDLELTEIYQNLSSILLDEDSNQYFRLQLPSPALLIEGITFAGKEIILEMERSLYRGDKYAFTLSAKRQ